jgi:ubiquitin-conjugating enzyme E2 J1
MSEAPTHVPMTGDASPTGGGGGPGSSRTLKRIYKELADIRADPSPDWAAYPVNEEEPYEWHFSVRGPSETEFAEGVYHGRFTLPYNYPFSPPTIYLLTPNGRFETNKKICLSISSWHPELWQPAWGLRTMIEGLRSLFPTPSEGAVGGLDWPINTRKDLAIKSIAWVCSGCGKENSALVAPAAAEDISSNLSEAGDQSEKPDISEAVAQPVQEPAADVPDRAPRRIWVEIFGLLFPKQTSDIPLFILDLSFVATIIFVLWLVADIAANPPK